MEGRNRGDLSFSQALFTNPTPGAEGYLLQEQAPESRLCNGKILR